MQKYLTAQLKLSGKWRGAQLIDSSSTGNIYALEIKIIGGLLEGVMKTQSTEGVVTVKKIIGNKNYINIKIKELSSTNKSRKKKSIDNKQFQFKYNLKTGYLEEVNSSETTKIVLYKSEFSFSHKNKLLNNIFWVPSFASEYRAGLSSPEKRLEELKSFVFTPIYFDVDDSFIHTKYHAPLKEIIKIIKSHSDLRIQVTGHTDSDGADSYNHSLSKRRAQSIISFFTESGLRRDRIVIDFKGEKKPVDSNETAAGKSKNRIKKFLFQIVHNEVCGIDMDRLDYLQRDSYHTNLPGFQPDYLINCARVKDNKLCFLEKAKEEIYLMFQSRRRFLISVCRHETVIMIEREILKILKELKNFKNIFIFLSNKLISVDTILPLMFELKNRNKRYV